MILYCCQLFTININKHSLKLKNFFLYTKMISLNFHKFTTSFTLLAIFCLCMMTSICQICPPRCGTCNQQNSSLVCTSCIAGFFFNNITKKCQICSVDNCATCSSETVCSSCVTHQFLINNTCQQCDSSCSTCRDNKSFCRACNPSFYSPTPTLSGICIMCNQYTCASCGSSPPLCVTCKLGYFRNSSKCFDCQPNCLKCTSWDSCSYCILGYGLINSTCLKCQDQFCLGCDDNTNICTYCTQSYTRNTTDNKCYLNQRLPRLASISRYGCKTAYDTNSQLCFNCDNFYYQDDKYCKKCSPGCSRCRNNTLCYLCIKGFVLRNKTCRKCPANCLQCSYIAQNIICDSCRPGTNLANGQCQRIQDPACLYFISSINQMCDICLPGYVPNSQGYCIKCQANCFWTCNPKNISQCRSTRFQLASIQYYNFGLQSQGCNVYLHGNCQQVYQNYYLIKKGNKVVAEFDKCLYPCNTCNSTGCITCVSGFLLLDGKCSSNISCNPKCTSCPEGTQRNAVTNNCEYCSTKCQACLGSTCLACYEGFYPLNNVCTPCPAKCRDCYDAQNCVSCARGYFNPLDMVGIIIGTDCLKCSLNCLACIIHQNICTSCHSGFTLLNNHCIKPYNVSFSYNIDFSYSTFLQNQSSHLFNTAVANLLGIDLRDLLIIQIKQGSTIISGYATTQSTQTAYQMFKTLKNKQIPGFKIKSYSIIHNEHKTQCLSSSCPDPVIPPQVQTSQGGISIGVIVGIAAGSAVVVILLIIIICYYRKNKTSSSPSQPKKFAQQPTTKFVEGLSLASNQKLNPGDI